jgi:hypothetical protein
MVDRIRFLTSVFAIDVAAIDNKVKLSFTAKPLLGFIGNEHKKVP